jgi:hypothetical protein
MINVISEKMKEQNDAKQTRFEKRTGEETMGD